MTRDVNRSGGQHNRSGLVFADPARKISKILMDLWEKVEKADSSFLTEVVLYIIFDLGLAIIL